MITKSQTASSVKKIEALRQEREQKEAEEAKKVEEFKRQLGEVLYACAYEPSSKWSKFRGGSVRELFAEIGIREAPSREASEGHEGAPRGGTQEPIKAPQSIQRTPQSQRNPPQARSTQTLMVCKRRARGSRERISLASATRHRRCPSGLLAACL